MSVTRKADVSSQIPSLWSTRLYSQAENLTFWQRFEGPEGSSMPLIRKDEFERQPGDTVKFDIVMALTGAGSTGDTTLTEGNEEKVLFRQQSMPLTALKHGVRWSFLSELLITHDMRVTALNQLRKWLAGKIDDRIFAEFVGSGNATLPTTAKWFAGSATAIGGIADSDAGGRLKLNDISDIKAYAMANNKIEPLRLENGEEIYGMVLHPYAALALKKDSSYQQAQREAQVRGADNPLFTGAIGMWDGVVLYQSNRVTTATDGAGSVRVARNIFFGAQAMVRGYSLYPSWVESEFSYAEEMGIATRCVLGERLVTFDLNASETTGDATDDTAVGAMILYSAAVAPTA